MSTAVLEGDRVNDMLLESGLKRGQELVHGGAARGGIRVQVLGSRDREAALRFLSRDARQNLSLLEMVSGLAHESRNALQRIQACLEMLELEVGGNAEALDLVARIQRAQDQLAKLYDDVGERGFCVACCVAAECDSHADTAADGAASQRYRA